MKSQSTSPLILSAVESPLPQWLKHLRNKISENLPKKESEQFAQDFIAAIPVGADINQVLPIVTIARLERYKVGSEKWGGAYREQVLAAIDGVIALYRDSAYLAAESAAELAAESAARSADSAAYLADSAAYSAEAAANWASDWARSAAWRIERDVLLAALRQCEGGLA